VCSFILGRSNELNECKFIYIAIYIYIYIYCTVCVTFLGLIPIISISQYNFEKSQEQYRLSDGHPSQCQGQVQQVAMDGWADTSRVWDHCTGN